MRLIWFVGLWCCVACQTTETPPAGEVFVGDFVLVRESDWPGGQSCQYAMPVDQTVCRWGRLAITVDSVMESVLGSDVHQGTQLGPSLGRDSVMYAVRLTARDVCTVFIAGNTVKPNGPGILAGDTLQFAGYTLRGDTLRWVYAVVQVQRPRVCA